MRCLILDWDGMSRVNWFVVELRLDRITMKVALRRAERTLPIEHRTQRVERDARMVKILHYSELLNEKQIAPLLSEGEQLIRIVASSIITAKGKPRTVSK